MASVADAAATLALDAALTLAGEGVVHGPGESRSLEDEQRRIDDLHRGISAGAATTCILAEVLTPTPRIVAQAGLHQFEPSMLRHVAFLGIGVHPEYQGQGIGPTLMRALIEHAKQGGIERLELYVRADNARAQGLYRSLGFVHEGTKQRFVKTPDGYVDDQTWVLFLA
jgi:putative acetyltransferase